MITTTGLFDSFSNVVRTVDILRGCGFSRDEISVITHRDETDEMFNHTAVRPNHSVDKRKLILPTDLDTFVVDERSLFVRDVGWVAAAGPLALILAETMDETQSSDLIDTLVAFDVSDEEAEYYAEGVRRGGTLLAVTAANHLVERAEDVLLLHGAVDTHQLIMRWRQQGWNNFSLTSEPYRFTDIEWERRWQAEERKPGRDWTPYDKDFRSHFYLVYSDGELPFEYYAPAYRYGYHLASDQRYDKKDWYEIETQAQQAWERQYDTIWGKVMDAVSYGFLAGRANHAYRFRS